MIALFFALTHGGSAAVEARAIGEGFARVFAGEHRGVMWRACAWCKCSQGMVPCEPEQHGGVSHGICPVCKRRVMDEARAERREKTFERMSNTTVMSRRKVAEVVGPEAAALVSQIEHAELEHGEHWRWTGEQVFTAEGVRILADKLAEHPAHAGAALALREEAKRVFVAPAAVASSPAEPRRAAVRNRADAYVAES